MRLKSTAEKQVSIRGPHTYAIWSFCIWNICACCCCNMANIELVAADSEPATLSRRICGESKEQTCAKKFILMLSDNAFLIISKYQEKKTQWGRGMKREKNCNKILVYFDFRTDVSAAIVSPATANPASAPAPPLPPPPPPVAFPPKLGIRFVNDPCGFGLSLGKSLPPRATSLL